MKKRYLRIVRRMYRALRHPRLRHRDWWQALTHALFERRLWMPCRDTVATGLAIGLFFAVMPVPLQMIFAGVIAMRFRSNVPIAMASCWLSNPVTNVPIWAFQLFLGNWLQSLLHLPMPEILGMQSIYPASAWFTRGPSSSEPSLRASSSPCSRFRWSICSRY